MAETTQNAAQCAGQIFELFKLDELVTHDDPSYVNLAMRLITDHTYYNKIVEQMHKIDIAHICNKHNSILEKQFSKELRSLQT